MGLLAKFLLCLCCCSWQKLVAFILVFVLLFVAKIGAFFFGVCVVVRGHKFVAFLFVFVLLFVTTNWLFAATN